MHPASNREGTHGSRRNNLFRKTKGYVKLGSGPIEPTICRVGEEDEAKRAAQKDCLPQYFGFVDRELRFFRSFTLKHRKPLKTLISQEEIPGNERQGGTSTAHTKMKATLRRSIAREGGAPAGSFACRTAS
jgi:hypothetical protein